MDLIIASERKLHREHADIITVSESVTRTRLRIRQQRVSTADACNTPAKYIPPPAQAEPATAYGERYFKASGADIRTKVIVIKQNAHKYSVSVMCKRLGISRSSYYYEVSSKSDETELEIEIKTVFHESRDVYGSRKIKRKLAKRGFQISRRRICRIMKKLGLVSIYTLAAFRPCQTKCNESSVKNEWNRCFHGQEKCAVVVSDLTYVRVNYKWNYICVLIDLFNREIIGFSVSTHKDAALVYDAFAAIMRERMRTDHENFSCRRQGADSARTEKLS